MPSSAMGQQPSREDRGGRYSLRRLGDEVLKGVLAETEVNGQILEQDRLEEGATLRAVLVESHDPEWFPEGEASD